MKADKAVGSVMNLVPGLASRWPGCRARMKQRAAGIAFAIAAGASLQAGTIVVPATSDPWLAGMPSGSTASSGDTALAQSPVLWPDSILPGATLILSASGLVCNVDVPPYCNGGDGPNGSPTSILTHYAGAENGISNITAPADALIAVFLGAAQPDLTAAPLALDFSTAGSRMYSFLAPELKQVFYVAAGSTIIVPAGATRLYLGTMDGYQRSNNSGDFTVSSVPEPCTQALLVLGAAIAAATQYRRRRSRVPPDHCHPECRRITLAG